VAFGMIAPSLSATVPVRIAVVTWANTTGEIRHRLSRHARNPARTTLTNLQFERQVITLSLLATGAALDRTHFGEP
jgi:hypothetical protein